MNPFALQDEARRNTVRLSVLAFIAVAAVVVAAALVFAYVAWMVLGPKMGGDVEDFRSFVMLPKVAGLSLIASLLVVLVGFFIKRKSLSSPESLMESVGATRIRRSQLDGEDPDTLARLRLFNVCEEMSIASGVSMPSIWLLPTCRGINAFVAGTSPEAAALCVTDGALRYLERDELQGVIAHEFSHILNGDMLLNFRLLMLVSGVTAYSRIGKGMFSYLGACLLSSFSSDTVDALCSRGGCGGKRKRGMPIAFICAYVVAATLFWLVGTLGVFFARLVQCAVSRQREFLADASSAQFTRNPEALANALRLTSLVDGESGYSRFGAWRDDVAHMLFTEGSGRLFATHPSMEERIGRLSARGISADAGLKERVRRIRDARRAEAERSAEAARRAEKAAPVKLPPRELGCTGKAFTPAFAARLRTPDGAGSALVELLTGHCPEELRAHPTPAQRRDLASRCVIAIRDTETPESIGKWSARLDAAVKEDGVIDSFEFMLLAAMRRHLGFGRPERGVNAGRLTEQISRVIATVASFGSDPEKGYRAAETKLSLIKTPLPPMPAPYDDAFEFLDGISSLADLMPLAKHEFLCGLQATVAQDGKISDEEGDYVAAVADAIAAPAWRSVGGAG